jgi:drug/metabolite transporter (DMT)-like permease
MVMGQRVTVSDWSWLALLVSIWGSSFAMSKLALLHLDAAWVMALRLAVAAAVLIPYAWLAGPGLAAPRRSWFKFIWLGFIGNALPFYIVTYGMNFVTSGVAGLLMGAIPLFVVLFAHVALPGEQLTLPKAIGFLLGFTGIIVLIGPEAILTLAISGDELKGELLVLFGCLCYGIHAVSAKRLGVDHPARQSAAVCLSGAVMGLAFAVIASPQGLSGVPAQGFLAVLGLGLLPTAAATLIVYRLMARTGPSFVSYSNYLVPVFAVLLGAVVLNETLHWNILAALLLVLAGIAVSRIPATRERTA